mmetsp:Transcript_28504/g.72118  ORF Transcript_28504/g.72118 Transcript_28504/m.72118 type:complete len:266 (-) Transcript_28504:37-834(-)
MPGILLDEKIRDYVLLPIFVVVVLTSALRSNLLTIFKSDPKVDLKEAKNNNMLQRCRQLRASAAYLSGKAFTSRKAYFIKKDVGALMKPPKQKDPMEQLSAGPDPMAAMGMLKNQMVFMVLQGGLGYWVSHCFSGFLVAKTPFPLTFQFKSMLQRGVEVASLEPGYVSALCWYIVVMMTSSNFLSLVQSFRDASKADPGDDPMSVMMGPMSGGMANPMMGGMGGPDMSKIYKQEQESLEILQHDFVLENIETELWRKWRGERPGR